MSSINLIPTLGTRTDLSCFRIAVTVTAFAVVAMVATIFVFMCRSAYNYENPSPFNAKWIVESGQTLKKFTVSLSAVGIAFAMLILCSFQTDNSTLKKSLLSIHRDDNAENIQKYIFSSIDGADDQDMEMAAKYLNKNEAVLLLYNSKEGEQIIMLYRKKHSKSMYDVQNIKAIEAIPLAKEVNWKEIKQKIYDKLREIEITHLRIPSSAI